MMKKTIKNTLEKTLNFVGKQKKKILIVVTALGMGVGVANAENQFRIR
jgi:hypothetical protein